MSTFLRTVVIVPVALALAAASTATVPAPAGAVIVQGVGYRTVAQNAGCFVARCAPPESRAAFADFLTYVARIPDRVLRQGDAATNEWIRNNARGDQSRRASAGGAESDALGCIGAVGAILVGVLVPAAKLLKIKQLIKDLGGAISAARLLVGAGTVAEKTEAIATALGFLVAELIGIKGVRDNCFS